MTTLTISPPQKRTAKPKLITGEELYEMNNVERSELVEGKLKFMSPTMPRHGKYESLLSHFLMGFVYERDLGDVMTGEVGIYIKRNPDTIRAADVIYISYMKLDQATPKKFLDVAPELVAEIMSPNDRWSDVRNKLREYFSIGVKVVIVVEPKEQILSVFRSMTDVQELSREDTLTLEDILPGFALPLSKYFRTR
jgi:Uma2 family endonuclease